MISATSNHDLGERGGASTLELGAAVLGWTIFSGWASLVMLFYTAVGGSAPTTYRGEVTFLIVVGSILWVAGVWTWVEWWRMGRTRLWPLPLALIPGIAFWPLLLLLGWPGVRSAILPRRAASETEAPTSRLLGVPRATFPFAVLYWVTVIGIWPLLLLLVPAVRRTVVPRRGVRRDQYRPL